MQLLRPSEHPCHRPCTSPPLHVTGPSQIASGTDIWLCLCRNWLRLYQAALYLEGVVEARVYAPAPLAPSCLLLSSLCSR